MTAPIVRPDQEGMSRAVEILLAGGLVITPTVTNYNLVGDATNRATVERIFEVKKRAKLGPLPVSLPSPEAIRHYVEVPESFPEGALEALLPGEVSFVFRQRYPFPDRLTCGLRTVAVSVTSDRVFRSLVVGAHRPIAATSANLSGQGDIHVDLAKAVSDIGEGVDLVIDAGPTEASASPEHRHRVNTIVDFTFGEPHLCRRGWVPTDALRVWFPSLVEDEESYRDLLAKRAALSATETTDAV